MGFYVAQNVFLKLEV